VANSHYLYLEGYYLENLNEEVIDEADEIEVCKRDEAPDRLWLVIRSLRSSNGARVRREVITFVGV
jgi:hypothetical protein